MKYIYREEAEEGIKSKEALSKLLGMKSIMSDEAYEKFIKTPIRSFSIRHIRIRG